MFPSPDSPDHVLLRPLLRDRAAHLRWLAARYGATFTLHDLEEVLQDAYLRALTSLRGERAPEFASPGALPRWFRVVMDNTARDAVRSRDGRTESAKALRPALVPLDAESLSVPAEDEDVETRVVAAVERDDLAVAVVRALRDLPDVHARILHWRFVQNLEPRAIMDRERLTLKAYEGRLTRAVKAAGAALADVALGLGCAEARKLLEEQPDLLLERGAARAHLDACAPCQAFQRRLQGALAALPVPAIAPPPAPAPSPPPAPKPGSLESLLSHHKLVAALAAGAIGVGGGAVASAAGHRDAPPPAPRSAPVTKTVSVPFSDAARGR